MCGVSSLFKLSHRKQLIQVFIKHHLLLKGYTFTIINSRHINASVNERIHKCCVMSSASRCPAPFPCQRVELLNQSLSAQVFHFILDISVLISSCHSLLFYCFLAAKVVSNYAGFLHCSNIFDSLLELFHINGSYRSLEKELPRLTRRRES